MTSQPHLDNRQLARSMMQTIPMIMAVGLAQLRAIDITTSMAHIPVLGMVSQRGHTLNELAERMYVTKATMSKTISTLEDRGWVTRRRSERDRRLVLLEITDVGLIEFKAMIDELEAKMEPFFEGLNDEQRQHIMNGITVLRSVFRTIGGDEPHFQQNP